MVVKAEIWQQSLLSLSVHCNWRYLHSHLSIEPPLSASQVVPLDWWPLTRDCLAYGITVSILICIMHDEYVQWYEAFLLVSLYAVYLCIMYYDKAIQNFAKSEFFCL